VTAWACQHLVSPLFPHPLHPSAAYRWDFLRSQTNPYHMLRTNGPFNNDIAPFFWIMPRYATGALASVP
jgi:hypothetical protein